MLAYSGRVSNLFGRTKIVTDQEHWLTVEDVAHRLDVTEETVRRLLRRGDLPGMQISKRSGWRVRVRDVDAFIRSRFRASKTSGVEAIE